MVSEGEKGWEKVRMSEYLPESQPFWRAVRTAGSVMFWSSFKAYWSALFIRGRSS